MIYQLEMKSFKLKIERSQWPNKNNSFIIENKLLYKNRVH